MATVTASRSVKQTSRTDPTILTVKSKFQDVLDMANMSLLYWKRFEFWRWITVWCAPFVPATAGGGVSFNPDRDIPDLDGKVILITGGNAGIGKETALQLAGHNPAKIFLTARSEAKGSEAIHSIKSTLLEHPKYKDRIPEIIWLPLDLCQPKSIENCATEFKSQSSRLDILILNAGMMYETSSSTASDPTPTTIDLQIRTNHLGHFQLFNVLLPTLTTTPRARIVVVSSEASNIAPWPITFTKSDSNSAPLTLSSVPHRPFEAYAYSKALNIYFASHIPRLHPNLTAVSVHPGLLSTSLYTTVFAANNFVTRFVQGLSGIGFFQTATQGAWGVSWAAVADEDDGDGKTTGGKEGKLRNGGYYTPVGRLWEGHRRSEDVETAERAWEWSTQVVERWK